MSVKSVYVYLLPNFNFGRLETILPNTKTIN